ncbi:hypothetical protein VCHENC01_2303, partial [Vibrio harveyi]
MLGFSFLALNYANSSFAVFTTFSTVKPNISNSWSA